MGFSKQSNSTPAPVQAQDVKGLSLGQSLLDAKDRLQERERRKQGMESTVLTRGQSPSLGSTYGMRSTLG